MTTFGEGLAKTGLWLVVAVGGVAAFAASYPNETSNMVATVIADDGHDRYAYQNTHDSVEAALHTYEPEMFLGGSAIAVAAGLGLRRLRRNNRPHP